MAGAPDPKPKRRRHRNAPRRIIDPAAIRRSHLRRAACASCGREASNRHHIIARGSPYLGDDVEENLAPICGSGTSLCHGAYHGSPYVDRAGKRWTEFEVRERLGVWIAARPATVAYVIGKLGAEQGQDYLRRRYFVEV